MIRSLLHALRIGASVPNPTPLKWTGVAVAVGIIALEVAKSYGVLVDVQESAIIELIMAVLVLYAQIASTEKIGILPPDRRAADSAERVRAEPVPTDASEAIGGWTEDALRHEMAKRAAAGFRDEPFFRDS